MKTIERIFKHLNEEKVELKSERVELGAIDDLKKKLDSDTSKLDKSISKVRGLASDFVELEQDFQKISNEASLIRKKLADIGVDDPQNLSFISLKSEELAKLSRQFINDLRQ